MFRTSNLDKLEKERIAANNKLMNQGVEVEDSFEFEQAAIHDPYTEESGIKTGEPAGCYGAPYIKWYLSPSL